MTGTFRVGVRVAGLCLDRSGHLSDNAYLAMAVRAGLLVDLALAQRLTQTDDSIELDCTPTGWPAADRTLDRLSSLDGRSLDWWLAHGAVRLADLATDLVTEGTWTRLRPHRVQLKPRYAVRDTQALAHDRALLSRPDRAADNEDAAMIAIARAAGLARGGEACLSTEELLVRIEPVTWVGQLVADSIGTARIDGTAVSGASQTALWSGIPY